MPPSAAFGRLGTAATQLPMVAATLCVKLIFGNEYLSLGKYKVNVAEPSARPFGPRCHPLLRYEIAVCVTPLILLYRQSYRLYYL